MNFLIFLLIFLLILLLFLEFHRTGRFVEVLGDGWKFVARVEVLNGRVIRLDELS
ncbi:MAG: hypothetical protein QXG39_06775 [Candidatus Aenigmatarchaeota archaeon]